MPIVNTSYMFRLHLSDKGLIKKENHIIYENEIVKDKLCFYIGLSGRNQVQHIYSQIPKLFLKAINNKRCSLMIACEFEAFVDIIEEIYIELVCKNNIDASQIIYVTGTPDVKPALNYVAQKYKKDPINIYWFSATEKFAFNAARDNQYISSLSSPKNKKFLCLNRRWRPHRPLLITKFFDADLLNDGFISLGKSDDYLNWEKVFPNLLALAKFYKCSDTEQMLVSKENQINQIPELYLDTQDLTTNHYWFSKTLKPYYDSSFFSVITETNYFEEERHLTEKTFRAILFRHPFILVSPLHSLKLLTEMGYKTFHPFINENYDNEIDPLKRMNLIVEEVVRLCKLTETDLNQLRKNIEPILEHNYNVLISKNKISHFLKKII